MMFAAFRRFTVTTVIFCGLRVFAQSPFQFPTANHALYEPGHELAFFAPTAPDKPWTSGSFGCVRNDGWRMHEGLDIRHLQTDRHGEPTDPVMATADGTVMYFSKRSGLSNYGNYIVIRHVVEGLEIYSLYAHLSEVAPTLKIGQPVKAGQVIGIMGRTSSDETILKERAHVHFELNVLVNDNFASWFNRTMPGQRNDHGEWNGQNLNGLDDREILIAEHDPVRKFSLLEFLRSQNELCRVQIRATSFPYLKRYPQLVLANPVAGKQGIAGYEVALNYNGVAFALMPLAESQMKSRSKFWLVDVNEQEYHAHPCRKLVVERGSHWQLTDGGLRELGLLVY
jgi:murein DD-endopeptidase MepM/ murein hydrolase activator NlpD